MWSCMPGGLREVVLSFKFRQNRLNVFEIWGSTQFLINICRVDQDSARSVSVRVRVRVRVSVIFTEID